jgi:hypothetical protein
MYSYAIDISLSDIVYFIIKQQFSEAQISHSEDVWVFSDVSLRKC